MILGIDQVDAAPKPETGGRNFPRWPLGWVMPVLLLVLSSGCSMRKYAINKLGDALAQSGSTFASDDDPELVRQAVPFSLKLIESLLAESPRHSGLLLGAARGFTQFAFAFVQEEADEIEARDLTTANEMRQRARRLYLRARNYGLRELEVRHAGFERALRKNPQVALRQTRITDVSGMYWAAASWAAAIALAKDNPDLIADLPLVEAMIDRAFELQPDYDQGALPSFLINFEWARKSKTGDPAIRARAHFDRAMRLCQGLRAGPLVSLAETASVNSQNVAEFKALLQQALAIDPNVRPEWRLENLVMQRRAHWLLSRIDELFLVQDTNAEKSQ